jgi:hypothetical protein
MKASSNRSLRPAYSEEASRAKRTSPPVLQLLVLACLCSTAHALPVLTEIHYNGVAAGSDPDEFIEISNGGSRAVDLSGYSFTAGISFSFPQGSEIAPDESLVIARDPEGFRSVFTDYSLPLFDFGGALSNSGETLTLADAANSIVWSLSYDDSTPWPNGADGGGLSLQLGTTASDYLSPRQWIAAQPTPGAWRRQNTPPSAPAAAVPAPMPLLLLAAGLLTLRIYPRRPADSPAIYELTNTRAALGEFGDRSRHHQGLCCQR